MKFTIKNKELITVDKKESIKELVIPDGVEIIGKAAFKDCENLKKVTFNDNINIIDEEAFMGCTALEEIGFNSSKEKNQESHSYIHEIRKEAFSGCKNLKKVNIEEIGILGDYAFANCINLEWLKIFDIDNINNGWSEFGLAVFGNCKKLLYNTNLPVWVEVNKIKLFGLNIPTQFEISRSSSHGSISDSIFVKDGKTNTLECYSCYESVADNEKLLEIISIDELKKMSDREWYATDMYGCIYYEDVDKLISKSKDEDLKEELQGIYYDDAVGCGFDEIQILSDVAIYCCDSEAGLSDGIGKYSTGQVAYILEIIDRNFSRIEKAIRYIYDKCNQDYEEFKKNCYASSYSFNWLMYSNKEELVIISKNPERNEIRYKNYRESI